MLRKGFNVSTAKIVGWSVLALIGLLVLSFVFNAMGWVNLAFWGPKYEDTKRDIFENTQSYVHGKTTHIAKLRLEYESTESETRKKALKRMILTEASTVENELLPPDMQAFISRLRGGI